MDVGTASDRLYVQLAVNGGMLAVTEGVSVAPLYSFHLFRPYRFAD